MSTTTTNSPVSSSGAKRRCRNPFLKKPMSVVVAEELGDRLTRHMTLFDLLALGVGGTVGSGVFVLAGSIAYANEYPAGPSVVLSFLGSGVGCIFSGLSFSEMASRIPSAGSTYAYAYVTLGEVLAFVAGWCLTLEYGVSSSAVARNWGDKVNAYLNENGWGWDPFGGETNINIWAGLMTLVCVLIMLKGLNVSKMTVNVFTVAKVGLVGFMTLGGFAYFKRPNLRPFAPSGMKGIFRGALKTFFGYLGFDEVCCMGAEALDPHRNIPLAVMGTVIGVTIMYILASLALVSMQPFDEAITHEENRESPFAYAFQYNGAQWAYEIVSLGELITLPLVVLVGLIAQPRLQFAMAEDGLLPKIFSEIDSQGNLFKGTFLAGIVCILLALFLPFDLLDDMTSAGLLVAFNLTNSGLIIVRRGRRSCPSLITWLVGLFNVISLLAAFLWAHMPSDQLVWLKSIVLVLSVVPLVMIEVLCPELETHYQGFHTPLVPWLPGLGIVINWFLLAQLSWQGIWMIGLYMGISLVCYFAYGYWRSVGAENGWEEVRHRARKASLESGHTDLTESLLHSYDDQEKEREGENQNQQHCVQAD